MRRFELRSERIARYRSGEPQPEHGSPGTVIGRRTRRQTNQGAQCRPPLLESAQLSAGRPSGEDAFVDGGVLGYTAGGVESHSGSLSG